jgi:Bifunctional DNA primase/polymerase, N-terminal
MAAVAAGFTPPPVPQGLREEMQRREEDPLGAANPYAEAAGWALYRALDQVRRMPVSRPPTAEQLLVAALVYTACGVPVFPCAARSKKPATTHGYLNAMTEEEITRDRWHRIRGPLNIAMPAGAYTADVLDIDVRAGGSGWAAAGRLRDEGMLTGALASIGTRWPGGRHLYFAGTWQSCGRLKDHHLDFKSGGAGYVLLPPSFVAGEDGVSGAYVVADLRPPPAGKFDWAAAKRLLVPPRPYRPRPAHGYRRGPGSAAHLAGWLEGEYEGNRNSGLFWACCRALEAGDESVIDDLAVVALSAGLGEAEVRRTVESAYNQEADVR